MVEEGGDRQLLDLIAAVWAPEGSGLEVRSCPDPTVGEDEPLARLRAIGLPNRPKLVTTGGPGVASALAKHNRLREPTDRLARLVASGMVGAGIGRSPEALGFAQRFCLRPEPVSARRTTPDVDAPGRLVHEAMGASAGLRTPGTILTVRRVDDHYKPTLTLLDQRGQTRGFAKLGWTPLTTAMVDREAAALSQVSGRLGPDLVVPPLLGSGSYCGHSFVVTMPMPSRARRPARDLPSTSVLRQLAGDYRLVPASTVVKFGSAQAASAARGDRTRANLFARAQALLVEFRSEDLLVSRSHGDWVPWNTARWRGSLIVWDWEHYADSAPVGVDAIHWVVMTNKLLRGSNWSEAYADMEGSVPSALAGLGAIPAATGGAGSSDWVRWLALYHAVTLLARSEALRTASGVEPFPLDEVVASYLDRLA